MTQAISRRSVATKALILLRARLCGICDGQTGAGTSLPRVFRFFSVIVMPPTFHCHSFVTDAAYSWQLTESLNSTLKSSNYLDIIEVMMWEAVVIFANAIHEQLSET